MSDLIVAPTSGDEPVPRRRTGRPRPDRSSVPAPAGTEHLPQPLVLTETPLVPSRSLGALLGLRSLSFKLESCQPTGTWLDRSAAAVVAAAQRDEPSGLCAVGVDSLSVSLAAQGARVGLRLIMLVPAAARDDCAWLVGFGAHVVPVQATMLELRQEAAEIAASVGLRLVLPESPEASAGLGGVIDELSVAGRSSDLLVLPALTGTESGMLTAARHQPGAMPLPLDGFEQAGAEKVATLVGVMDGSVHDKHAEAIPVAGVHQQPVSVREAAAAQRLLAQEEGVVASVAGAAGLAGLLRLLQADRQARPRERRLPDDLAAVVVVTRELVSTAGPELALGHIWSEPYSLDALRSGLARLLAEPVRFSGS